MPMQLVLSKVCPCRSQHWTVHFLFVWIKTDWRERYQHHLFFRKGEAIDNSCTAGEDRVGKVRQADKYINTPLSALNSPRGNINEHWHDGHFSHSKEKIFSSQLWINHRPLHGASEESLVASVLHIVSRWAVTLRPDTFSLHSSLYSQWNTFHRQTKQKEDHQHGSLKQISLCH